MNFCIFEFQHSSARKRLVISFLRLKRNELTLQYGQSIRAIDTIDKSDLWHFNEVFKLHIYTRILATSYLCHLQETLY